MQFVMRLTPYPIRAAPDEDVKEPIPIQGDKTFTDNFKNHQSFYN